MPNVKQADLNGLHDQIAMLDRMVIEEREKRHTAEARTTAFDAILQKIDATARGITLQSGFDGGAMPLRSAIRTNAYPIGDSGWVFDPYSGERLGAPPPHPDALERAEAQTVDLYERLIVLDGRLSAVVAVAQFAREHKA